MSLYFVGISKISKTYSDYCFKSNFKFDLFSYLSLRFTIIKKIILIDILQNSEMTVSFLKSTYVIESYKFT